MLTTDNHTTNLPLHARISNRARTLMMLVICSAFFMELLDATALNTSLPQIAHSFMLNPVRLKVIIIAYLLSIGLLLPASAYCAERFGMQRMFMLACGVFMLGSLGWGLSANLPMLVLSRIVQGVGGAFLTPVARMLILQIYSKHQYIKAQTIASSVASLGLMLGPLVGGVLTSMISWHAIFFVNLPVGLIAAVITYYYVPNVKSSRERSFDLKGFVFLSSGVAGILFFVDTCMDTQVYFLLKIVMLLVGGMGFYAYRLHNSRTPQPLFDVNVWQQSRAMRCMLLSFVMRIAMLSAPFLIPILLQTGYHMSAWHSGLVLIIPALGFGLAKPLLQRLLPHYTEKQVISGALLVNASSIALLTLQVYKLSFVILLPNLLVFGLTQSLVVGLCNSTIYRSAPDNLTSQITTINSSVIQLGACFAVTIASLILMLSGHYVPGAAHLIAPHSFRWVFLCEAMLPLAGFIALQRQWVCMYQQVAAA